MVCDVRGVSGGVLNPARKITERRYAKLLTYQYIDIDFESFNALCYVRNTHISYIGSLKLIGIDLSNFAQIQKLSFYSFVVSFKTNFGEKKTLFPISILCLKILCK